MAKPKYKVTVFHAIGTIKKAGKVHALLLFDKNGVSKKQDLQGPESYKVEMIFSITWEDLTSKISNPWRISGVRVWDIQVDEKGNISVLGDPTKKRLPSHWPLWLDIKFSSYSNNSGVGMKVIIKKKKSVLDPNTFDYSNIFKINLKGVKEKEKKKPVPVKTISVPVFIKVGSFAYDDAGIKKLSKQSGMLDHNGLKNWCQKRVPYYSKELMRKGELPGKKAIVVTGYADSSGPAVENGALCMKRATAVAKQMREWLGSEPGLLSTAKGGQLKKKGKSKKDPGNPDSRYVLVEMMFESEV